MDILREGESNKTMETSKDVRSDDYIDSLEYNNSGPLHVLEVKKVPVQVSEYMTVRMW